ncbi:MAG TPA: U32 family peptidase [Burkholderiales bacterium]|nr:U32 family peptidase [Burkholderiales bacterium]
MTRYHRACDSSIELNVATVWDEEQIARWAAWSHPTCAVRSVFGSMQQQLSGHGRSPGDVPFVEPSKVVEHARSAQALGLEFLYLLNGRCEHLDLAVPAVRQALREQIRWVAAEVQADVVVVADLRVARLVRAEYPADRLRLRVSTVAGVKTLHDLKPWLPLGIEGVVLHHDVGRDLDHLEAFASYLRRHHPGVEIELLLNESCIPACSTRDAHYARLARETTTYIEGFQQSCNIPRFRDPSLLLAARWIRPEDMQRYRQIGVRRFKIAGREMSGAWLDRTVTAYLQQRHQGNLIELFTMTPPGLNAAASDIVSVDNQALDGFLDQLTAWEGSRGDFYRRLTRSLWENGTLRLDDPGAEYSVRGNALHCVTPGHHFRTLAGLQVFSDPAFHGRLVQIGRQ